MGAMRAKALFLAGLIMAIALYSPPASAGVSFEFFYSNLSPHGHWLVSASYGRVWQPSIYSQGWNPYYDGHWVYTDLGYTWVSDYDWGPIPYHYGTWVSDPACGWVWVPGYVWAPAWVVFRSGPDYIGWTPVTPQFSIGVTIGSGYYDQAHFVFVPAHAFFEPRIRRVVVAPERTTVIVKQTRIITNSITVENNVVVNRGPSIAEIQRVTGRTIRPVPVERVRGLGKVVKRDEIRLDPQKMKAGLRAAEPVKGPASASKEVISNEKRKGKEAAAMEVTSNEKVKEKEPGASKEAASKKKVKEGKGKEGQAPAGESFGSPEPEPSRTEPSKRAAPERGASPRAERGGLPAERGRHAAERNEAAAGQLESQGSTGQRTAETPRTKHRQGTAPRAVTPQEAPVGRGVVEGRKQPGPHATAPARKAPAAQGSPHAPKKEPQGKSEQQAKQKKEKGAEKGG